MESALTLLMENLELGAQAQQRRPVETRIGSVRVLFGAGALGELGRMVRELGGRRVLLVTDRGLVRAGHAGTALQSLAGAGIEASVYDGVEENPTTRHVDEGVAGAREHAVDCIVGLGGGSALDCAKAVNFLLTNGGKMEDYWGSGRATHPMLPTLGVPTTAGTGSEAQSYALICQERTRVKMACGDPKARFQGAILDPTLLVSVPGTVAAATGIDAASHAVESYVCTRRNAASNLLALEAWRLIEGSLAAALAGPHDLGAWSRMLVGAHLAGAAIEQSMLGAAHACANPLTARFGVTHGIAVGLMLPHVVRFNAVEVGALYDELHRAGPAAPGSASLAERIVELCRVAGLPARLREVPIGRAALPELAAEAERQWTAGFNPRRVDREELLALYEAAY